MDWLKVTIETTSEATDAVADMLTALGASGVEIHDPEEFKRELQKPDSTGWADDKLVESLGESVKVSAYFSPEEFEKQNKKDLIAEKLKAMSNYLDCGSMKISVSNLKDEDWTNNWKKYYKPIRISESIIIKPTWEDYKQNLNEIVVEIDPGMAFGTGLHETTRMCAALLEKYIKAGNNVLDIGCGTGILSIIASKLGASNVTAVDIDEIAVKATKTNAQLNKVDNIDVFLGRLENVKPQKFDVIAANIIADVIIGISPQIPDYIDENGVLITSGIIRERAGEVQNAFSEKGYKAIDIITEGEWVAIVFKCLDSL
ncbi:MAG TPA: 50S ribosomal protein L11 methyltransferase [Clostridiaceae bacterium]|nr:50S ribosomal protein L11 methyltransferase [Clostridiaceae bacterium]